MNIPKNVSKQPQPKTRGGIEATAPAAKKKSDREDILRSQNNENCKSEEEDEEMMALIDEVRKIKKDDIERLKEVSKKITKVHQRQENIMKTREDPAHVGRRQRHQEHLEHQISEEKDTHPKDKKMKKAKPSHQE